MVVPLPHHRAFYEDPMLAAITEGVLWAKGLTLSNLKPSLLRRAYLPREARQLVLRPTEVSAFLPIPDKRFFGHWQVTPSFTLPPAPAPH